MPTQPNQSGVSEVTVAAVATEATETKKPRKPSGPRIWKPVQIVVRVNDNHVQVVLATKDELAAARIVMDALRTGDTSIQLLTVKIEA
mgnify:CR=1 FL=1